MVAHSWREQLLDAVWGSDVYVEARNVDVHVGRLRKLHFPSPLAGGRIPNSKSAQAWVRGTPSTRHPAPVAAELLRLIGLAGMRLAIG
jgi:hypothetical protein